MSQLGLYNGYHMNPEAKTERMQETMMPTRPAATAANPFLEAIRQDRPEIVNFLISTGFAVTRVELLAALDTGDPAILDLFADAFKAELPGWNALSRASTVITARHLLSMGLPVDLADPATGKFPHEVNPDGETADYLKDRYLELHPPAIRQALQPAAAWDGSTPEFSNVQLSIQELHAVNYEPHTGNFEIEYDGKTFLSSKRFLSSLARKLKVSSNIFRYFSGEEVLTRVAERNPDMDFRVTFDNRRNQILGVVDANKKILPPEIAQRIFADDPRTRSLEYKDGIISAEMILDESFSIAGDSYYRLKLTLHYPVDGVNMPSIFLAVERQVCANGATALVNAFRTEIEVNDHSGTHLSRLISSFSNESGFQVLENRLLKAQQTRASIRELMNVQNLISTQVRNRDDCTRLNERLELVAGDPCSVYEVTSLNNISAKRRGLLPVQCSVNDLINFCSELTSHHGEMLNSPEQFDAAIGRCLSQEFDLEEMYPHHDRSRPFYLEDLWEDENGSSRRSVRHSIAG